jgi:chromosome segregation ATPase
MRLTFQLIVVFMLGLGVWQAKRVVEDRREAASLRKTNDDLRESLLATADRLKVSVNKDKEQLQAIRAEQKKREEAETKLAALNSDLQAMREAREAVARKEAEQKRLEEQEWARGEPERRRQAESLRRIANGSGPHGRGGMR